MYFRSSYQLDVRNLQILLSYYTAVSALKSVLALAPILINIYIITI